MRLLRVLIVGLLLTVQPAEAVLDLLCRGGDRHQAEHCSVAARLIGSQMSAMAGSDPSGCRDMPVCREPAPYLLTGDGDQVPSPDLLCAALASVGTLHSAASERPPTPPPNG
jgi:hypothetical protein